MLETIHSQIFKSQSNQLTFISFLFFILSFRMVLSCWTNV